MARTLVAQPEVVFPHALTADCIEILDLTE
jgi:hypothetical protein